MAISAVHDWLRQGGDIARGVQLLKQYGQPSRVDLLFFSMDESPFLREKLTTALEGLVSSAKKQVTAAMQVTVAPVVEERIRESAHRRSMRSEVGNDVPEDMLPDRLKPLRRDLVKWHSSLKFLRGRLAPTPDGMPLRELADKIVALRKRINAGWVTIEMYRETGEVILKPAAEELDHGALMRERNTLRVRLSQHKTGARTLQPVDLDAKKARLEELNTLIDGPPVQ